MSGYRRLGCQHCRDKHLKCDKAEPTCSKCSQAGVKCMQSNDLLFRQDALAKILNRTFINGRSDLSFYDKETYKWVRVPRKLEYIDQTSEITATYGQDAQLESPLTTGDIQGDDLTDNIPSPPAESAAAMQPATVNASATFMTPSSYPLTPDILQTPGSVAGVSSHTMLDTLPDDLKPQESCHQDVHSEFTVQPQIGSPADAAMHDPTLALTRAAEDAFFDPSAEATLRSSAQMRESIELPGKTITTPFVASEKATPLSVSGIPTRSHDLGGLYSETGNHQLTSGQEAQLMRFFIDSIAPSFDLCDRDRHFALVVPQRALMCPILLNAVFAVSAKYLSAVSDFDPVVSDRHSQECLKHLIPKLDDVEVIMDENILAATVILRHLEELEMSMSGSGVENYLLGTRILMSAQEDHRAFASGLRKAVYWYGLRQEIYVSFIKQRPIHESFKSCTLNIPWNPNDDFDWANSIVARVAELVQFCFDETEQSVAKYDQIVQHFDSWFEQKPASYTPLYSEDHDSSTMFPKTWYLNAAIITGVQHYHLGRALLAVYNPRIPRLGVAHRYALRDAEKTLKEQVMISCGIALATPSMTASYVHACLIIALGGDRFSECEEQEALHGILVEAQKVYAWPTQPVQDHLREVWGW